MWCTSYSPFSAPTHPPRENGGHWSQSGADEPHRFVSLYPQSKLLFPSIVNGWRPRDHNTVCSNNQPQQTRSCLAKGVGRVHVPVVVVLLENPPSPQLAGWPQGGLVLGLSPLLALCLTIDAGCLKSPIPPFAAITSSPVFIPYQHLIARVHTSIISSTSSTRSHQHYITRFRAVPALHRPYSALHCQYSCCTSNFIAHSHSIPLHCPYSYLQCQKYQQY